MKTLTMRLVLSVMAWFISITLPPVYGQQANQAESEVASHTVEHNTRLMAIKKVLPLYPQEALSRGIESVETVRIGVNDKGNVEKVKIPPSMNPLFKQEVVLAARQWKFRPLPIPREPGKYSIHRLTFHFYIKDGEGHVELYNPPSTSMEGMRLRGRGVNARKEWQEWKEVSEDN